MCGTSPVFLIARSYNPQAEQVGQRKKKCQVSLLGGVGSERVGWSIQSSMQGPFCCHVRSLVLSSARQIGNVQEHAALGCSCVRVRACLCFGCLQDGYLEQTKNVHEKKKKEQEER